MRLDVLCLVVVAGRVGSSPDEDLFCEGDLRDLDGEALRASGIDTLVGASLGICGDHQSLCARRLCMWVVSPQCLR